MSYILDALKKAEKEHGLKEVPTLETIHNISAKKKTGIWIAVGCGALCLIAAVWLFFPASPEQIESTIPGTNTINNDSATGDSEPVPENREPTIQSSNTPVLDNIAVNPPVPEKASAPVDAVREEPIHEDAISKILQLNTIAANPEQEISNPGVIAKPSVVSAISELVVRKPQPDNNNPAFVTSGATTPAAGRQEAPKVSGNLPSLRDIAASMNISVHIYSENPEERMVFINRKQYKEGDFIEQDCVLESIMPEGVILKRGEETFMFR